ncbi:hypothetical protein HanXRQr2_Chr01g0007861 [Helianthus annuus]|uniref:Uncharacterized protein n=1 Tax=Helianthus annuus TaxID=4232 RepID=A0A9K3JT43_HELAN|nr:hypothetical protein HanXRQr2_Chr01g0007861 [Helianthus annuus]
MMINLLVFNTFLTKIMWRTQKLFVWGADNVFNHIFKGCDQVFCLKYTLNFFFQGVRR